MRLSQLTKLIDKGELISVDYDDVPIDRMNAYSGKVCGIKKDDVINKCHVTSISAFDDMILILISSKKEAERSKHPIKKGGE